ncbi:MAG: DUF4214 domain-containing protein, partial [Pirellulales bacterium]
GLYYLQGGGLSVSGDGSVSGNGVVIYNAPQAGKGAISITGQGIVTLAGPTNGTYQGIALFQDRSSKATLTVSGNGSLDLTGSLYAAAAKLNISGNGQANISDGAAVVVEDLNVSGNGLSIGGGRNAALVVGDPTVQAEGQTGPAATAQPVAGHEQSAMASVTLATFTGGDGSLPASDFSASIDWGDGTTSAGSVSLAAMTYSVSGTHTYQDEGSYAITISIGQTSSSLLASTTVATTATIHEELLAEGTEGSPNQKYIQEMYRDIYDRQADPTGREDWVGLLASGVPRATVAYEMIEVATSEEFQYHTANSLYQQYLHRAPEAGGEQFWMAYLYSGGGTIEEMAEALLGSNEYFQTRGRGTASGFLQSLFQDVLDRPIDSDALTYFTGLLAHGHTTYEIAQMIFNSPEYERVRVNDLYEQLLDRPADAEALPYFTAAMAQGMTDETIIARILASDEYFALSQE